MFGDFPQFHWGKKKHRHVSGKLPVKYKYENQIRFSDNELI